jgi:hypothetical protein
MAVTTSHPAEFTNRPGGQDFSLVLGGPLFKLLRRARLTDDVLGLLHRRIAAAVLITWAPLLALSALEGGLVGPGRTMPFLDDIGCHLRFLGVVPLLIVAELIVHRRMRPLIEQFRVRKLVRPEQAGRFADALRAATGLRNSVVAEVLLIAVVYVVGILFTLRRYAALHGSAWYSAASTGEQLSLAGLWFVFVSLPIIQFLFLRWYFRLFIWAQFLWRVARLDLDLEAIHPDKVGGLGFLGGSLQAFVPIAAAHGMLVAGVLADRIFFDGAKLTDFKVEVFGGGVVLLAVFAGPLTAFAPLLAHVRRGGLRKYGALGQTYVRGFRNKWVCGGAPADEPLLGSGDIQSLADLGNSFSGVQQMRIVPLSRQGLLVFVAAFLLPIAPLVLTMMSVEKVIEHVVGIVF